VIQVRDDGSTLIVGTSGIWSLTNPSGSIDVPAGVSALAPADAAPRRTSQAPQSGPAPLILPTAYVQGEQRDASGNLLIPLPPVATVPPPVVIPPPVEEPTIVTGLSALFVHGQTVDQPDVGIDVTGRFNASGQLVQADVFSLIYKLEGTHADFDTDGILTWGRWIGQVTLPGGVDTYSANQGLHYVIGVPTAVLPTTGVATYTLAGATRPTYLDGSTTPGTFTGSLSVTFGGQATINTVDWQVAMPGRTFVIANTQMSTQSSNFSTSAIATQGCLNAGCTTDISGFFAGAAADRVGAAYTINDTNRVIGAAAFKKQ
jgi:hypothetical protein